MKMLYKTQGTCCQYIEIEIDNDIVSKVNFMGGCHGNLQGISKLVGSMPVKEVISRLDGICCGSKDTSCPDQLCRALEQLSSDAKKEITE